jgi:hypothetical protein
MSKQATTTRQRTKIVVDEIGRVVISRHEWWRDYEYVTRTYRVADTGGYVFEIRPDGSSTQPTWGDGNTVTADSRADLPAVMRQWIRAQRQDTKFDSEFGYK